MNVKAKSALVLVATLIVGVVLGALVASRVINNRLDAIREMRKRGGFSQSLVEAIQPNSDLQREQVQAVLAESHSEMDSIYTLWRGDIRATSDSMRLKLESVLDSTQIERMTKFYEDSRSRRNRGSNGNANDSSSRKRSTDRE